MILPRPPHTHTSYSSHQTTICYWLLVVRALQSVVVEQLLDEIDVTHEHTAAAVTMKVQRIQRVTLRVVRLEKIQVRVPLVSNHLDDRAATGKEWDEAGGGAIIVGGGTFSF